MSLVARLWAFGGVSGLGWVLDTLVFLALVEGAGAPPFPANLVSAGLGVSFVFLVTHERLFAGRREHRRRDLLVWIACQAVLVVAASAAIAGIVAATGAVPLLVKVAVTPLTLAVNFLVLSRITRAKVEAA